MYNERLATTFQTEYDDGTKTVDWFYSLHDLLSYTLINLKSQTGSTRFTFKFHI